MALATSVGDISIFKSKALALKTPSQPVMLFAECHEKDVTIMFQAKSGSHIRNFVIQYNTTYDKDEWLDIDVEVPSNSTQVKVRLIPGVFQSFRVIAENEFGRSFPSEVSNPCEGKQEVPHKNPSNVTAVVDDSGKALKIPSQPWMLFAECHEKDVTVMFEPKYGSHIRNFLIQYNTSYNKDKWLDVDVEVPSNSTQVKLPLIPGVEQSFQVIAENEFGRSFPSEVSNPCKGKPEVPHKNPSNVTAVVDDSDINVKSLLIHSVMSLRYAYVFPF
ncbi:unnamed protein product [Brassicogethes aeneus]|uniref:Fibronectin type-III domain-containing protein n=1 Tax=Brassicogethes aeneus TaxID=1431903 RepID=A0A9P0AUF7_BRAAE|nr:unnamed protein product [Brassicogethes aeneus]